MWIPFVIIIVHCCVKSYSQPTFQRCQKSVSFASCMQVSFDEELLPGTVVDTYTFSDSSSTPLKFSITLQGSNLKPVNYLSLNTRDFGVDLVIGSRIDKEDFVQNSRALAFSITVTGTQVLQFQFYVQISDIDDNPPVFVNTSFVFTMVELDLTQSSPELLVSDPDLLNSILSLSISSSTTGSPSDFFVTKMTTKVVESKYVTTYSIGLNTVLNYSQARQVELIVQAKDSANHITLNSISITVIAVPNNPPIFLNLPYIIRMEEAQPVNTYVMTVSAIDGDKGINSPITYSFNDSALNQYFALNSTTGVIKIAKVIIRESADILAVFSNFNLIVIASKTLPIYANSSQTTINVQIIDINNQQAAFSLSAYKATIQENSLIGTPIHNKPQIIVTDLDIDLNAQYSVAALQNGNESTVFEVYPKFGEKMVILTLHVINSLALDYEVIKSFNVVIQTTQQSEVRNISVSSYANVTVSLIDLNDNYPIFVNLSYNFSILENSPMLTSVGTVQATDKDSGLFGTVTYSLIDGSNKFAMNTTTGLIYVNVPADTNTTLLDAENIPLFYVIGVATDGGGLMSYVGITINLIDVNDNPPIFQTKMYNSLIQENSLVLTPSIQVKATDIDLSATNRIIVYSLVNVTNDAPSFLSCFSIDNNTGSLTVVNPIDREALNQNNGNILTILVKASDPTKTSFYDYATVYLNVQDVNDNVPILNQTVYSTSIPQNVSTSTVIIPVSATDNDQANTSNSQISYKLLGNDSSRFVVKMIGSLSKEAYITRRTTDPLAARLYNLTIEVADNGFPQLSGTSIVLINLTTINSQNPVFNQTLYLFNVNENVVVGTVVGQVLATDADTNANLMYSIYTNQLKAWNSSGSEIQQIYNFTTSFIVNPTTGIITTFGPLDREISTKIEFQVLVTDLAAQTPNQTATATINVIINDLNDNPPIFQKNIFYLNLYEDFGITNSLTTGATGLFTIATDVDVVGVLSYNLSEPSQTFSVDRVTAQVFLIKALDRENVGFYNFQVYCSDGIHLANALVSVTVLDINDNEPFFNGFVPNITIAQNTSVGTLLARFNTTDMDIGQHAQMSFRLNGGEMMIFNLSNDGNLTVANSLVQNPKTSYILFIEVYDDPYGPYHLRSNKQLTINIILINTPPVFSTPSYGYSIPENILIGFKLDELTATDTDTGQNGVVNYQLLLPVTNPNPIANTLFRIEVHYSRAQIFVNSNLQYKAGQYVLILRALDNGTPALGSNFTMYINVTAINYFAPNFTNPTAPTSTQSVPIFNITEHMIGTITNITAYDPDGGVNGMIRYSLQVPDLDNANFTIDPLYGTLANVAALDRRTKAMYSCRIRANDLGSPSLSSYVMIQVIVLADSTYPPMFPAAYQNIFLSTNEGPRAMSPINNTQLSGFNIGNVAMAIWPPLNYNSGINPPICYLMMKNISNLYLESYTGNLFGLMPFDRQVTSSIQIGIKAVSVSQCNSTSLYFNSIFNASDSSQASLVVQIIGVNNHPPYFTQTWILARIPRSYAQGATITDFSQYSGDVDLASQGQLRYSINGDITISSPLNTQLQAQQIVQIFTLNSISGILSIGPAASFLNIMQGYCQMTIVVSDGMFTATTSYRAYLVSQSQRLIIIVQDYLPNVANKTGQMVSYFSQKIGYNVYTDGLEVCTDILQNMFIKCTCVYIYGLNASTGLVVDGISLLNGFTIKLSNMTELNNKYLISNVLLAAVNNSYLTDSSTIILADTYRLIIIVICCLFLLIIIITCATVYVFRSNYQRKMKAYTTSSSDHTAVVKAMSIPGTNMYENSKNPFASAFDNGNVDHVPNIKKYGVPDFGSGITLERGTVQITRMNENEYEVMDSTETVF